MTVTSNEVSGRYRRLAAAMTSTIDQVPPHRWGDRSPCEQWTALDVVRHVVQTQGMFESMVGREPVPGPDVEEDALGAWAAARDQVQGDLDDPGRGDVEFEGQLGASTFAAAVDRFLCLDLVVHRWDLARAVGLDDTIPADDIALAWSRAEGLGEMIRSEHVCGPAVEPPPGADEQTRLLAHLGRQV